MITDIFLYLVGLIMTLVFTISDSITGNWTVWPASFLNGLTYFFQQVMVFNFLLPIDTLFDVIKFVIAFEVMYLGVKILFKLFNFIRGASGIEL